MSRKNKNMNNSDISTVTQFERHNALIFFLLLFILFSSFLIMLVYQHMDYINYDSKALKNHFRNFGQEINEKFYVVQSGLEAIKVSAENDLFESSNSIQNMPFTYRFMKYDADSDFFHMDEVPKKYKKDNFINLTGKGILNRKDDPDFLRRIRMYLHLMDDFKGIKQRIPSIVYLYSITIDKALLQFPWLSSIDYKYSPKLYDYDVWKKGLPKNNPSQRAYWTDAYFEYEGGLMTSCAVPVYDGKKFVCIIAADIVVDFLNQVAIKFEPERHGTVIIYDRAKNLLAHPALISSKDKIIRKLTEGVPAELSTQLEVIINAPDNKIQKIGNWKFLKYRFTNSPFHILYIFPEISFLDWMVGKIGIETISVIICLILLFFAFLLVARHNFVAPSDKFVNFILAKSRGEEVYPSKKLPQIWRPWFTTINDVFNKNNMLTEKIKQNNIVLVHRNTELQREIGAKEKAEKEKEALEKQLIEEEKLKAIGLLVGGIAHDFNNQLAIIMGYTSILRSQAHLSEDKKQQCLDQMLSAADSSSGLIKQLLAFAQKGKYQNIPIDIHEIINDIVSILNHTIDKRITIKVDFSATLYTVQGDRAQIQNAIMNIAINAKNAMPNGGMITFKTINEILTKEQCKHSEFNLQPGKFIKISIIDTGIGITAENRKHIFEPFFTTKNSMHGTGLGLAAALGAIKNHKGYIAVEDTFGIGSNFSTLLPVMGKNVIGKVTKTIKINVSESKSTLLLIDDEAEFCRMLTDFMGALGYTVITYTDPLKAIEYYRKSWKELDLVIMDMIMPKISGFDMINEFQRINSLVRIVISSGYSAEKDVQKLLDNHDHILGFYKKPFDLVKFANDIASLLEQ